MGTTSVWAPGSRSSPTPPAAAFHRRSQVVHGRSLHHRGHPGDGTGSRHHPAQQFRVGRNGRMDWDVMVICVGRAPTPVRTDRQRHSARTGVARQGDAGDQQHHPAGEGMPTKGFADGLPEGGPGLRMQLCRQERQVPGSRGTHPAEGGRPRASMTLPRHGCRSGNHDYGTSGPGRATQGTRCTYNDDSRPRDRTSSTRLNGNSDPVGSRTRTDPWCSR